MDMRLTIRSLLIALVTIILIFTIVKPLSHTSVGFYVKLPLHVTESDCGDRRDIFVHISSENSLRINGETVQRKTLGDRFKEIYRVRAERVLFVSADPDVSFQDVVGIMDVARGSVTNLYVSLLTPAAQKEPCLFIKAPMPAPRLPGLPQ